MEASAELGEAAVWWVWGSFWEAGRCSAAGAAGHLKLEMLSWMTIELQVALEVHNHEAHLKET